MTSILELLGYDVSKKQFHNLFKESLFPKELFKIFWRKVMIEIGLLLKALRTRSEIKIIQNCEKKQPAFFTQIQTL